MSVYSQRLPKIFRAPIYRAHRVVIFAIAQLSCYSASADSVHLSVHLSVSHSPVSCQSNSCYDHAVFSV